MYKFAGRQEIELSKVFQFVNLIGCRDGKKIRICEYLQIKSATDTKQIPWISMNKKGYFNYLFTLSSTRTKPYNS